MKTKRMIDEQRILNIITAAKMVVYGPMKSLSNNQLTDGPMTDQIRVIALSYLIDEIRDEVGLNFGDVTESILSGSLKGESGRFAKEAIKMSRFHIKILSGMEDNHD